MKSIRLKHLFVLLAIIASSALIYAACSRNGSSTKSVFSVSDENGRITLGAGGCNVQFWYTPELNVKAGNLTLPEANPACTDKATGELIKASKPVVSVPNYGDYEASTAGDSWQTFDKKDFVLSGGSGSNKNHYDNISLQNGASLTITGSSSFKSLSAGACNGKTAFTFAPGHYSIGSLNLGAGCHIAIERNSTNGIPAGKVTLHFNQTTTINGGKTCLNMDRDGCASAGNNNPSSAVLARQYPEMFQIVVHNGNFVTQAGVHIAGGILVENKDNNTGTTPWGTPLAGLADFGTPSTIIGEVIAQNIKAQNNSDSIFYYKSTSGNELGPPYGYSTIAPPAIPAVTEIGSTTGRDLAYLATQKLETTGETSGHLFAYKIDSNAQLASAPAWDAADVTDNKMSASNRRAKLYTNLNTVSGSAFTLINDDSVPSTPLGASAPHNSRSNKEIIFDPNAHSGAYLSGRKANSMVGRPWRTAPVIARSSDDSIHLVLFATDDGALYAVDGSNGHLKWGWIPKEILPLTANPKGLMDSHPWGQLNYIEYNGAAYVVGTALSGALHFSLKLTDSGLLDSIAWYDYQSGGVSPTVGKDVALIGSKDSNADNLVGAAPGGEAPVQALFQNSFTKGLVAYIRDAKVYIRRVDVSGVTPSVNGVDVSDTYTPVSQPDAVLPASPSSNLIFVNSNKMLFGDKQGQIKWFNPSAPDQNNKAVFSRFQASSAEILGITPSTYALPAGRQMMLVVYDKENVNTVKWMSDNSFSKAWHIGIAGSTSTSDTGLPELPSGTILSAVSTIYRDRVFIPFTIPTNDETCEPIGYTMGPLDLETGQKKSGTFKFNGSDISNDSYISIFGRGEMQALRNTRIKGSDGSKKDWTVGLSNYGNTSAKDGWGAYEGLPASAVLKRLLWRELTNY